MKNRKMTHIIFYLLFVFLLSINSVESEEQLQDIYEKQKLAITTYENTINSKLAEKALTVAVEHISHDSLDWKALEQDKEWNQFGIYIQEVVMFAILKATLPEEEVIKQQQHLEKQRKISREKHKEENTPEQEKIDEL